MKMQIRLIVACHC